MVALMLLACRPPDVAEVVPTPDVPEGAPVDFTPGALLDVRITMEPDDFTALREQTRNGFGLLSGDCLAEPFPDAFTWFEADLLVDGRAVERVGVRKKGFLGSLDEDRPSLKLKTDVFVDGQTLGGTERITLNNQISDPGRVRACLAYAVFEAAGVPAPRCNFAHVRVNGEDLGAYAHVEAVKRDFLQRAFGEDGGHLYEGTLSDFRPGWTATFEAKTDDTDPSGAPLQPLVDALQLPDDALLGALEPLLDQEAFLRFWAAEVLVGHFDGYGMNTNNFYVYVGSDGRARFAPWGADEVMRPVEELPGAGFLLTGELVRRLYALPGPRQAFRAELQRQVDEVFDADALIRTVDDWEATLAPVVLEPDAFHADLDELREWIEQRPGRMQVTLDDLPEPDLEPSEPICFTSIGTVSWAFDTTFSADLSVPAFGDPVSLVLDGTSLAFSDTLSLAGPGDDGEVIVATLGAVEPGMTGQIVVGVPPERFAPGVVPLDFLDAIGFVALFDEVTEELVFQGLIDGDVVFDAAGGTGGQEVRGTVTGEVYPIGF